MITLNLILMAVIEVSMSCRDVRWRGGVKRMFKDMWKTQVNGFNKKNYTKCKLKTVQIHELSRLKWTEWRNSFHEISKMQESQKSACEIISKVSLCGEMSQRIAEWTRPSSSSNGCHLQAEWLQFRILKSFLNFVRNFWVKGVYTHMISKWEGQSKSQASLPAA